MRVSVKPQRRNDVGRTIGAVHIPVMDPDEPTIALCGGRYNPEFMIRKGEVPTCHDCDYEMEVDNMYRKAGY